MKDKIKKALHSHDVVLWRLVGDFEAKYIEKRKRDEKVAVEYLEGICACGAVAVRRLVHHE